MSATTSLLADSPSQYSSDQSQSLISSLSPSSSSSEHDSIIISSVSQSTSQPVSPSPLNQEFSSCFFTYIPPRWNKLLSLRAVVRYIQFSVSLLCLVVLGIRDKDYFLVNSVILFSNIFWSFCILITYLIRSCWPLLFRYINICEASGDCILLSMLSCWIWLYVDQKTITSDIYLSICIIFCTLIILLFLHLKTAGKAEETMAQSYVNLSHEIYNTPQHPSSFLSSGQSIIPSHQNPSSSSSLITTNIIPTSQFQPQSSNNNTVSTSNKNTLFNVDGCKDSDNLPILSSTTIPTGFPGSPNLPADLNIRLRSRAFLRHLSHHPRFQYNQILSIRGLIYAIGAITSFIMICILSHINYNNIDKSFTSKLHTPLITFHIIHLTWCLFASGMTVARQFTVLYACYTNFLFFVCNLLTHSIGGFLTIFLCYHYNNWNDISTLYLSIIIVQIIILLSHIYTSQWSCHECLLGKELQQANAATGITNLDINEFDFQSSTLLT